MTPIRWTLPNYVVERQPIDRQMRFKETTVLLGLNPLEEVLDGPKWSAIDPRRNL